MASPTRTIIQVRRDTAANWASNGTTLAAGEIGIETPASAGQPTKIKVGDGTTAWGSLPYAPAGLTYSSGTNAIVDRATNIAGGGAGYVPWQSAANTTSFVGAGATGYFLKANGTSAPSWYLPKLSELSSTTATEFRGIISGTTGTGNVVFSSAPALTSPVISTSVVVNGATSGATTITATDAASPNLTLSSTSGTLTTIETVTTNFVSKTSTTTQTMAASLTVPSGKTLTTDALTASGTVTLSGSSGASTGVAKINASGVLTGGNAVTLTSSADITGVLPVANGGLGVNTGTAVLGTGVAAARSVLRIFVQSAQPSSANITGYSPAVGDIWLW